VIQALPRSGKIIEQICWEGIGLTCRYKRMKNNLCLALCAQQRKERKGKGKKVISLRKGDLLAVLGSDQKARLEITMGTKINQ